MNFLKKSLVKRESFKKKKGFHIPGVNPWVLKAVSAVLAAAVIFSIVWYVLPVYHAKYYLTRSALQTREHLRKLWDQNEGEGDAYEDYLKLVADEVKWNGHSVLLLPGGLGISFTEQRNQDETFAQGTLNVYFLGAIREGISYWANQDKVVFHIPGITQITAETSQNTLKDTLGIMVTPKKKREAVDRIRTLEKDTIHMMGKSQIRFSKRNSAGVVIEAEIPAAEFDSYLAKIGDYVLEGPLKDMKDWGQMLKDRKTQGETQKVTFVIDKSMNVSEVHVEGLGDLSLGLEGNGGLTFAGSVSLGGKVLSVDTKLYFGNGAEGKRSFQITQLDVTYNNGSFDLILELSGGYQGGRISSGAMEPDKLVSAEGQPEHDSLKEARDLFIKKIRILGFDLKE
ncbi:hypothetical protein [Lacrimispora sp.]|uniref:hypothetical protein n=1 Tax=Lacrimispora sp. TaxID=2719234 RepID=UPI0039953671